MPWWTPPVSGPIKAAQITVPFYASWPSSRIYRPFGRLNPDYQQISQIMSRANSTYEAAMLKVDRYGRRGLSLHAHYTYAHAMDWNPNESRRCGNDVLDLDFSQEYGASNLDMRHSAGVMAIYEAPWKLRGMAGKFGNGWMLSGVGQFRSGLPYTMRISGSLPECFVSAGVTLYTPDTQQATPALIVGLGPGMNGSGGDNRVYGLGSDGTVYNIGRNTYRYPATWKADLRLGRRFDLGHMRQLELLAESFNLFNHQNVTELETTGYYHRIRRLQRRPAHAELPHRSLHESTGHPEAQHHGLRPAAEHQRDQLLPRAAVPVWVEDAVLVARYRVRAGAVRRRSRRWRGPVAQLGQAANVDDEIPHLVVLGAARGLGRHLALAVADDVEQILVLLGGQRLGIGPIVERQSHILGQIGFAIPVIPMADRAVLPHKSPWRAPAIFR